MTQWPPGIRWRKYSPTRSGNHTPGVSAYLLHEGREALVDFIVDTGAVKTLAPRQAARNLGLWDETRVQESGMRDAQGKPIKGLPIFLEIKMTFAPPTQPIQIRETVWFCENIQQGLLGQSTAFEQLGAVFLNFPNAPEGRRFGLFPAPR